MDERRAKALAALGDENEAPFETVYVDALGSDVNVRGLLLSERLALAVSSPDPEEVEDAAAGEGNAEKVADAKPQAFDSIARMLALCVSYPDGSSVYSAEEWQRFGGKYFEVACDLWNIASRRSGLSMEVVPRSKN